MVMRAFVVYLFVELAVLAALISTIGFGSTLLLVLGSFIAGLVLAGSQAKSQLARLRSGSAVGSGKTVGDGALVAVGTVLVAVPGVATTLAGALALMPPTRAVVRPILAGLVLRTFGGRAPAATAAPGAAARRHATGPRRGGEVIDGEVIDVTDTETATDSNTGVIPPTPNRFIN